MRRLTSMILAVVGALAFSAVAIAESGHTADDAKAFVQKAAQYLKSEGKEKALAAFNDPKGAFVDGDLYLVAMDWSDGKMTMLAHGTNKAMVGKPQADMKDAEGRDFMHEVVAGLGKSDEIWVSYSWPNPATKKIARKKTYYTKAGDVVIGAGVYE